MKVCNECFVLACIPSLTRHQCGSWDPWRWLCVAIFRPPCVYDAQLYKIPHETQSKQLVQDTYFSR